MQAFLKVVNKKFTIHLRLFLLLRRMKSDTITLLCEDWKEK